MLDSIINVCPNKAHTTLGGWTDICFMKLYNFLIFGGASCHLFKLNLKPFKICPQGVEGFKFLVNEAMQYIHTRMRILTRAKLYWALVVHRHCSDSFRICFIFVAIHKKICLYSGNFDVNKELSTFIDKMSTHLNEGTQEGLNKYLANCEVIERIFLPFGKGPIQNLLDSCNFNILISYNLPSYYNFVYVEQGWPLGETTWAALLNFTIWYKKY